MSPNNELQKMACHFTRREQAWHYIEEFGGARYSFCAGEFIAGGKQIDNERTDNPRKS